VEQIELPEEEKNLNKKQEETSSKKNTDIPIKQAKEPVKKTADGQTLLDVSKGNITLTSAGATGGGTSSETSLNPLGYRIKGTTTSNCIKVEPGVTTDITLDNVSITSNSGNKNCMDVSHANVTITLVGENLLSCGETGYGALVKDGMDDDTKLVIQCEHAGEKEHQCTEETCGSLEAKGTVFHATAIGNSVVNRITAEEDGFSNLHIRGGIIKAKAGGHNCAIGAACGSSGAGKYAKDIRISGGVVTAEGGQYCAGIGSGCSTPVDGIYITGGTVYAYGGENSPGIGSGGDQIGTRPFDYDVSNIVISGGNTLVRAVGHQSSNMPGIGCGKTDTVTGQAENVSAVPDSGYQGYIQDGTSEAEYNFTVESPFPGKQDIKVDKYFTIIYFGPFRDENKINSDTKEQLGANHIISKTGGEGFDEEQLKELTKANGKDKDGNPFNIKDFILPNKEQIDVINEAKMKGEVGDYQLTVATENNTQVTITVSLRGNGTDAAILDGGTESGMVGANDVEKETGGKAFGEDEIKELCGIKGKDKDGNNLKPEDFKIDKEQLKIINEAKTSKNTGKFLLTYETRDGEKLTVEVLLTGTVKISFDTNGGSRPPEMQSTDSGKKVLRPEAPVREGYIFDGWYYTDKEGNEVLWDFEEPVYENMMLKARWKEEPKTETTEKDQSTTEKHSATAEKPAAAEKPIPDWEYSKRKITEKTSTKAAKTGDEKNSIVLLILLGASLAGAGFMYKKMR
ncbi:InlB B-repeat-containing protein, partial [Anaerostipes sp.]|uniref:InlB B-repeat-containing protein n=1 Tax=Anaerostipes sp. TaxID=1872530 RepID=UPI002ED681F2